VNKFGNIYSQYYDLLYGDKDYKTEVEYINKLIKENSSEVKILLDMGCGTGKHAELLCDKGYKVHGIDLSKDMLKIAENRRKDKEDKLSFSHSNIQELNLDKKFDAVVSLFHVMSYQNSNDELIKAFKVAIDHLKDGGIFIFDFWYGPAVLTDLPVTRIKRLVNEKIKVTRLAEPVIHPEENIVDVNFDIFIENLDSKEILEKKELHKMRYFFDTELDLICKQVGFKVKQKYQWLSEKNPDFNSWNVVWILKK
jgi:SAM-dependent methyltransferase